MSKTFLEINLLPPESVQERYSFGIHALSIGILSASFIVFGLMGWMQRDSAQHESQLITQSTLAAASVQQQLNRATSQLKDAQTMQVTTKNVGPQMMVQSFVNELEGNVPTGSTLTSIQLNGSTLNLVGDFSSMSTIAAFQDALQKLPTIQSVFVQSASLNPKTGLLLCNISASVTGGAAH